MFRSPLAELAVALGPVAGSVLVGALAWVPRDAMADGHVIGMFPGAAGSESGWVIDPTIGAVLQRVTRPAGLAWVPRAVLGATVVLMDGADSVTSDPAGTTRWRFESQAGLLFASPLLQSTRGPRSSAVSEGTLPARAGRRGRAGR